MVSKRHFAMHPIANRLDSFPAPRSVFEQFVGGVGQKVNFTVPAVHEELQNTHRENFDCQFFCLWSLLIRYPRILDESGVAKSNASGRGHDPATAIPKAVGKTFYSYIWVASQIVRLA